MSKLEAKGRDILKKQFYERSQRSRNETKLNNGRKAVYNTISSKNSLRQHLSQWKQFANYADEKGIKGLKKLDNTLIYGYIRDLQVNGMAEKTLKSRISAINHVLVGSGVWKENQRVSLKEMRSEGHISASKGPIGVYKGYSTQEWIERHHEAYTSSQELIDFCRAFGLRRSEIFGKKGSRYQGVTFRNLGHMPESERLFAEVIGKGGKYRVVPVRDDFAKEMWAKYGEKSRVYRPGYFKKQKTEREQLLKTSSKASERLFKSNKQNIPLHIHRNDYVRQRLIECQKNNEKKAGELTRERFESRRVGYTKLGFIRDDKGQYQIFKTTYVGGKRIRESVNPYSTIKIADWHGYVISACQVMENVGHNRLDVLLKYLV